MSKQPLRYSDTMPTLPEPWLRGPIAGVNTLVAPLLYAFQHAREDLEIHTEGLTIEQVWLTRHGLGSVGFHLRHIAGSTDRLITYLQGGQLSERQMAALELEETTDGMGREQLLAEMDRVFHNAERVVREIDAGCLADPREVGRKRLPSTVIGLLTHIAEHIQRHVGQAVSAARLARIRE